MAAALVLPAQQAGASAAQADSAPQSEEQRALADAADSGHRVEVTGERTERTTVYANPDGYTFTLEEATAPVRVPASGGGWQAPDATLVKRADGSVAPKAAAVQMAFSGGGDKTPLARITDQGRSLQLDWPGSLPAPTLDGASAVYPEVLPGVDLQVNATPESLQPVFVVKTPKAAESEALKKLTFDLTTENLQVRKSAAGSLAAVDGAGRTVFRAPPARMWDSAGDASGTQTQLMRSNTTGTGDPAPADPAETAPSGTGLEPGQGDKVADMGVAVTDDALTVVPDPKMLTGTDASAFPLFIDPNVSLSVSERTLLRSDGYESYGWGNGSDNEGKGVGHCGTWNGYYCGPGYTQRLYYEFSPSQLSGKKILDATFRDTETWSFTCDLRLLDLVRTNNISSATTWATRPTELDWMVDRWVSAGRGSDCDPSQPDAPIELHDNPQEPNENLTPTVQSFAAGNFSRLTLELRAHDESDTSAWKRFRNDAALVVQYVPLPAKPDHVGLASGSATVCNTSVSDPQIVSDTTPLLRAVPHTQPGGGDGLLRVYFDLDELNSDGTWTDTPDGGQSLAPSTPIANNKLVAKDWATLTEGKLYRYHAWTWSYYDDYSNHLSSQASDGFCYFKVDPTRPKVPQVTIGSPYTECVKGDCAPHGGPGVAATFTFAPDEADSNVVSFEYRLSTDTGWTLVDGSSATVSFTPQEARTYRLQVRGRDDVEGGRPGETRQLDFIVAPGAGPTGNWHFNESSGAAVDSATDGGVPQYDANLYGGATRDDRGRQGLLTTDKWGTTLPTPVTDQGLALDGSTGYAATSGPVVDTRASYTVSAWARLDTLPDGNRTVLGQDGTFYSGFYLSYLASAGTWTLRTSPQDDGGGNISDQMVVAQQPATVGVWTHLAAEYDASAKEIRLYVNGKLQGSHSVASSWDADGPLQIGRVLWAGSYYDYFSG
ncbi:LamG domain-containing protein, partial [Streptomyces sp. MS06]|uniref:LamG domain-containing protein n=1 Tax=Streptomyces sp. MS06 TaxID=3385974 RepID=UPI0039A1C393